MCGIAGFTHHGKPSSDVIRRSTETLRHRGPDELNIFQSGSVSLGAVRLKIIDLQGGQQPMSSGSGDDVVLVFNGEIYNHAELREQLLARGHKFHSNCDTEVALRAFEEWDVDCLARFRGMFAAAFWQERSKRLVLVRDRLGIKPLYYAVHEDQIYFGSEPKAILAHDHIPRTLSQAALAHYLCLNYVPGTNTLLKSIRKVSAATWLEWRRGRLTEGTYWRNVMRPEKLSRQDAVAELDRLLAKSVREHLIADVPLSIWLSGGLDSTTILHYSAAASATPIRTFSLSFRGKSCDESRYSRAIARHYGTQHKELDFSSDLDLTSAIHDLSYYSDEPSADAGALPLWFLARMTSAHARVALSGEGSDEIFGGYSTYIADRYSAVARRFPKSMRRCALRLAERLPVSNDKISFEYKLKRFLAGSLLPSDEAHFFWNGTFSERERSALGFVPDQQTGSLAELFADLPLIPAPGDPNRYLFADQQYYLADDILSKCDRVSMAHAVEVRPPFLDHRIVEFAGRVPHHLKIQNGKTKIVLRELMKEKFPQGISNPRKEGLDIPAHDWLRGPLQPLLREALSRESINAAGLFSYAAIDRLITAHCARRVNLGYHLWGLLTLHLWIRRWKVQVHDEPLEHARRRFAAAAG